MAAAVRLARLGLAEISMILLVAHSARHVSTTEQMRTTTMTMRRSKQLTFAVLNLHRVVVAVVANSRKPAGSTQREWRSA